MFANNEKISQRQLTRLLILDWTGKFCLLLPVLFAAIRGVQVIGAIILAVAGAFFYTWILGYVAEHMDSTFSAYLRECLGIVPEKITGVLFLAYLLLNQIYLARAAGRVCSEFLLPESSESVLAILFLLAGLAAAWGSVQKRARTGEVLFPVLAVMLIIMLAASARSIQWDNLKNMEVESRDTQQLLSKAACMFAAFSGMGVTLYQVPHLGETCHLGTALKKSVVITGIFQAALFLVMMGAFGKNDLAQLEWPVLVLMSNVNIPGGFLQRWDIIFLSAILFSLLTASGTGIYYMGKIWGELSVKRKSSNLQIYSAGISAALVLLVGNYERIERIFARWAICGFMPLLAAVPILLAVLERVKRCRKQKR